ncbi:hypothetical protein cand_037200 [Cryptosporidium andersoni]|uniref:Uncharacterized protein n=1 Tax=Cryptosporidium andersoni TaxID=117008 RepID=A0A1J4MV63_9CRYT|nr:hypothetical protein cand_037200 [Cryptosporidium andersoni]
MLSDSSLNYLNRHPIENILDEDELLEWESDLNTITPETAIRMCNLEKMKGTDDLFLPCTFDETYIYEQEAIETQLLTLQHELELQSKFTKFENSNI